jgi:hypothetical protein
VLRRNPSDIPPFGRGDPTQSPDKRRYRTSHPSTSSAVKAATVILAILALTFWYQRFQVAPSANLNGLSRIKLSFYVRIYVRVT